MAYNPSSLAHIRRQVSNLQVRFSHIVKKKTKKTNKIWKIGKTSDNFYIL